MNLLFRKGRFVVLASRQHDIGVCFNYAGHAFNLIEQFFKRGWVVCHNLKNVIKVTGKVMTLQYIVFALNEAQKTSYVAGILQTDEHKRRQFLVKEAPIDNCHISANNS